MRWVVLIAIILSVVGCKKPKPSVSPFTPIYYVGDTITLKYRECKEIVDTVANESYKLCLDSIYEARVPLEICPYFYGITYAGIRIRWVQPQIDTTIIILKVLGCNIWRYAAGGCEHDHSSIDTVGYKFCFLRLDPYPDTTNYPIPLKDYIATLKIARP